MAYLGRKEMALDNERRERMKARGRVPVDYEIFIKEWMAMHAAGGTRIDLSKKMDISYDALLNRFYHLREIGVQLPSLRNSNSIAPSQIDRLQSLVSPSVAAPKTNLKKPPVV